MIEPARIPRASRNRSSKMVTFHNMTLRELADWVSANNNDLFDTGEFPAIDDLEDEEEVAAREEYESMADDILMASALGPCNK
jgi:hypothetical protein